MRFAAIMRISPPFLRRIFAPTTPGGDCFPVRHRLFAFSKAIENGHLRRAMTTNNDLLRKAHLCRTQPSLTAGFDSVAGQGMFSRERCGY